MRISAPSGTITAGVVSRAAPVLYIYELASLAVDADGRLWCKMASVPDVHLGVLEELPDVPAGLAGELTELLDIWRDGLANDERAEWRATYEAGLFRTG